MLIPEHKVKFKAARSHKPGGQGRDHRSTKVQLWVHIDDLPLNNRQKRLVREKLERHINHDDELWVENEEERSQEENKEKALKHLNQIIEDAIKTPSPRIPTEPPRNAENKRIHGKKLQGAKKHSRQESHHIEPPEEDGAVCEY